MKKLLLIVGLISYTAISHAQTDAFGFFEDALRFSQSNYSLGSSARMQAIGGAQISLGGDISSALSNPAGLGFFNRSVFTVSPSMNFTNSNTDYFIEGDNNGFRNAEENNSVNFNIANIGAVINWNKGRFTSDKFKGGSLAISVSRANSFRLNRSYEGENDFNSIIDFYADDFGGYYGDLAFEQYLVDEAVIVNEFGQEEFVYQPYYQGDGFRLPIQNETIEEKGSEYSTNIAWGGNYDDRLYFGGGMGLRFSNFRQNRVYTESEFLRSDDGEPDNLLNSINQFDDLTMRSTGINFNAGVIARPVNFLTLGISYTSPTFYSVSSEFVGDLQANWFDGVTFDDGSGDVVDLSTIPISLGEIEVTDYNIRTPSRLGLGTTLFVGKSGFLSGDVEFIDYGNANINSNDFNTSGDNQAIEDLYASVMNIRVGGEYRIQNFMLRAGYALLPSPYQNSNLNEQTSVSFGLGYRNQDYFLDFAVVSSNRTIEYLPYSSFDGSQPTTSSEIDNVAVTATFGLNF